MLSLDALRGFDMLIIIGLAQLICVSAKQADRPWLNWLAEQMKHPRWEGYTILDQVFPLFLFIAGVAIPYSVLGRLERGEAKWRIHLRIFRRLVLLILLGVVYNGGLRLSGWDSTRFASVLGFIGVGYFVAALIVLHFGVMGQIVFLLLILLGYWAALLWIPVPGVVAGVMTPKAGLAVWLDQQFLPGRFHFGTYDPQGIMPCIGAIATALTGTLTGHWLRRIGLSPWHKAVGLCGAGLALIMIGWAWGHVYIIAKNLWTGSFILWTSGISLLLLALFYTMIDVLGFRKWAFFFVVIGVNAITIYLASMAIDFRHTANFCFAGTIKLTPKLWWPPLFVSSVLMAKWFFLYFLYRHRVFLRV
ncbi:MAG: DUF5009 domain-containing protein [bacterium]|nr:DUF5009 domain-containing protein [bacterium]